MFYLLVGIFILFFAYLCWQHLDWAFYLTIICLPAYGVRFSIGALPLTLLEVMIVALFGVWLMKAWHDEQLRPSSKFFGVAAVIFVIATMAMLVSPDLRAAAGLWKAYFLEPLLFFLVFSGFVKTKDDLYRTIMVLGIPALYISTFAIVQKLNDGWLVPYQYWYLGEGPRVTSFFSYPNAIGLFVAPIVVLFIGYWYITFRIRDWPDTMYSAAVIITGLLAIYWAHSEGALVGIMAALVFMGLADRRFRWLTIACVLLLLLVVVAVGAGPAAWQKLTLQDWSGSVRLSMWGETAQLLQDHWIIGAGLAGYPAALVPYHRATYLEIFLYPHNFILNFWVELGLAGLLAFGYITVKYFWLAARLLFTSRESKMRLALALSGAMVVIVVHGLVDVPYFKNDLAVLWWILVGMMSTLSESV
ncbi:O-antigen ligase family protein [Candidatus Falkowbacteria bacterium]|nr:O-antigen ligase family protein [Candidatus Falkowbacteria bacterium]